MRQKVFAAIIDGSKKELKKMNCLTRVGEKLRNKLGRSALSTFQSLVFFLKARSMPVRLSSVNNFLSYGIFFTRKVRKTCIGEN